MQCAVINAQSVRNTPLVIADFVADNDLDFLAITETWLKQDGDLDVIHLELLHLEIFLMTAVWLFVLLNHLILQAIVLMLSLQGNMTI